MKKSRIGILTGGGDCAGLNSAITWVVKTALDECLKAERGIQYEVIGIQDGWKGLATYDPANPGESISPLTEEIVRNWDRHGGTNLGTSRTNLYDPKNNRSKKALENINRLGLDVVIAIGGDDTMGVACKLSSDGINVIGIPKTIDKDLSETEYSLGYDTALNVIVEEVDRLRTTAGSHKRIFVVETMGRHAGWLALEGGEAAGAGIILIPEHDFSIDRVYELLVEGREKGARYDIVLVAEGAKPTGGQEIIKDSRTDAFGHIILGGIGDFLTKEINDRGMESRCFVLGHLQRSGIPTAYDRRMGRYFGIAAVDLVVMKDFGKMVCLKNGRITACPLENVVGRTAVVDTRTLYDTDRYNGRRTILLNK